MSDVTNGKHQSNPNRQGRVIFGWGGMSFQAPEGTINQRRPTAPAVPAGRRAGVTTHNRTSGTTLTSTNR